jgi:hypothetical protein
MPFRAWLLVAALGLALVSPVVAQDQGPTPDRHHHNDSSANQEHETAEEFFAITEIVRIWELISGHHAIINAIATLAIAAFTLTLALTTRGLWKANRESIDAMLDANRTAKRAIDIGQAQVRAYLSIESVEFILDLSGNKPHGVFDVTITNSGHSPAFNAAIAINVHDVHSGPEYTELRIGTIPALKTVTEDDGVIFEPGEVTFTENNPSEMVVGADVKVTAIDIFGAPITIGESFSAWLPYADGSRVKMHRAREKFAHIVIDLADKHKQ